jgi:hypothetical protein
MSTYTIISVRAYQKNKWHIRRGYATHKIKAVLKKFINLLYRSLLCAPWLFLKCSINQDR